VLGKREKRKNIFKKNRKKSAMSNSSVPAYAPSWAIASTIQDESTSLSQLPSSAVSCILSIDLLFSIWIFLSSFKLHHPDHLCRFMMAW